MVSKHISKHLKKTAKHMQPMGEQAAELAKKGLLKSVIVDDKAGQRLSNFYTGKKFNSVLAPAIMGGAVLAGGGLGVTNQNPKSMSEVNPLNAMSLVRREIPPGEMAENPYMIADGTAGELPTNAPSLGTNGAMVFGMHNRRNGGYV